MTFSVSTVHFSKFTLFGGKQIVLAIDSTLMRAYKITNLSSFFFFKPIKKKINKLFTGFGSVRIVKNCDRGLENAARGRRPRAAFSRPRSQFFTIRTSQPVNNIYLFIDCLLSFIVVLDNIILQT